MSMKTQVRREAGTLVREGTGAARHAVASPLAEFLMRLGYIVRGLVYGAIGFLALEVALDHGGSLTDTQGAIASLGKTPLGVVVLYAVTVGLIGYALWGAVRAVFDPLHKGTEAKGIVERIGFLVSGISYGLLAVATIGLIQGSASAAHNGAQTQQAQQATADVMSYSWGALAVGAVGLLVIGIGVLQIVQGVRRDFERQFDPYDLSAGERKWIDRTGRFGMAVRGLVFAMIGVFLIVAAYQHEPSQARGIDGVLTTLLHQPYGPWLLGVVALGLIAFGIFSALSGFVLRFKR